MIGRRAATPDTPAAKRHEMRPFSIQELLDVVVDQRRFAPGTPMSRVLGLTGLRFGELRGLMVADTLEVPYPALRVSRSVPASGGGGKPIVRERTKSGVTRTVRRSEVLIPVIRRSSAGKLPDDLLFSAPQGGWTSLSNWRR